MDEVASLLVDRRNCWFEILSFVSVWDLVRDVAQGKADKARIAEFFRRLAH